MVRLAYASFGNQTKVDRDRRQDREDNGDHNQGGDDDRDRPHAGAAISNRRIRRTHLAEGTGRLMSENDIAVTARTN